ncbi:MAG: porin family protein [Muribaculaceae bacterium]|nr:porin family protein [Muribaculaceae bacterium]
MKNFKRVMIAMLAVLAVAFSANAQFRFGIKAGVNISSLSVSNLGDNFSSDNRTGFTGGLMTEFTVPIIGIGMDASLMYVHRTDNIQQGTTVAGISLPSTKGDYLEVPINLKYKLGLPIVGKIITPYIYTGPAFAFRCSSKAINAAWEKKAVDVAWNVGIGLQLVNHLQIGAGYGFGMNNTLKFVGNPGDFQAGKTGKNNSWTITAAYLF